MTDAERDRFDALLEEALAELPEHLAALLEETPLIVEDRPEGALLASLAADHGAEPTREFADEICGLFSGAMMTERTVEGPGELPNDIRLFRVGIIGLAGGWAQPEADDAVYEEIMVTLLHEIGHHFGLEEGDLEQLGYD